MFAFVSSVSEELCGGTLKTNTGQITAPDLDGDGYYDFNLFCLWLIQVDKGNVILYEFEYILLERTITGCQDYISVSYKII